MGRARRRRFLLSVSAILIAGAIPIRDIRAQQPGRIYRVGVLFNGGSATMAPHRDALRERLAQRGFVEGRNLQTAWRAGSDNRQQDREAASALVAARPDAILAFSSEMTQAVQWATKSIPIVFAHVSDPIADGLVKDYARPDGNTTGASVRHRELLGKRLELLRELLPGARRVALTMTYVSDPSYAASEAFIRDVAARLKIEVIEVGQHRLFEIRNKNAEAIVVYSVLGQSLTTEGLINIAKKLRIASIFPDENSVVLGGLASYGTDPLEDTRLGADQLARVLNGARPDALPVDQNSRFVLVINLKTAKELGLKIPQTVLVRADRVIE